MSDLPYPEGAVRPSYETGVVDGQQMFFEPQPGDEVKQCSIIECKPVAVTQHMGMGMGAPTSLNLHPEPEGAFDLKSQVVSPVPSSVPGHRNLHTLGCPYCKCIRKTPAGGVAQKRH